MTSRQDPVTIFSSFLVFRDKHSVGWAIDPKLRRSMLNVLSQPQQTWESYWYERYLEQLSPLPAQHLCAYLQSVCYTAAKRIASSFSTNTHSLEDLFQAAMLQTDRILQNFEPELGYPLKHYASSVFESAIRQTLREQKEVAICSDCSLLRATSQKRLRDALSRRGLSQEKQFLYIRAWQSFKLIYVPDHPGGTRALNWPSQPVWVEIFNEFNRGLPFEQQQNNPANLEVWMKEVALTLREYLCPTITSLNQTLSGFETGELIDSLVDDAYQHGLDALIQNESAQKRLLLHKQMNSLLLAAVNNLEPRLLTLLQYVYADGYTQTHIGNLFGERQYTICRWHERVLRNLVSSLALWSRDQLHISLSLDVLETMGTIVKEWLKNHFSPSRPS
ncbi:MAG: sigma-70 family RNA polymerase sigma factor [Anaerolineae bacterium]|nr:sigma-70 family RNA polymerase sigma factor [Gloeobacterales cyanobacterium ES-bin-313]